MFIKVGFGQEYITCLLLRIASYFLCLSRPPLSLPRNPFLPCNRFLPPFLYLGKLSTLINIRQGLTHCHLLLQLVFVFRFAHLLLALLQQFLTHSLELLLQFLSRSLSLTLMYCFPASSSFIKAALIWANLFLRCVFCFVDLNYVICQI